MFFPSTASRIFPQGIELNAYLISIIMLSCCCSTDSFHCTYCQSTGSKAVLVFVQAFSSSSDSSRNCLSLLFNILREEFTRTVKQAYGRYADGSSSDLFPFFRRTSRAFLHTSGNRLSDKHWLYNASNACGCRFTTIFIRFICYSINSWCNFRLRAFLSSSIEISTCSMGSGGQYDARRC